MKDIQQLPLHRTWMGSGKVVFFFRRLQGHLNARSVFTRIDQSRERRIVFEIKARLVNVDV